MKCFFDIEIDGQEAGRIDFELFGEQAPKTVNNFLALCSGEFKKYYWYKGSTFHKIVSGQWIMGGDLSSLDGTGSLTIYDDGKAENMEAETNLLKFTEPYLLVAPANEEGKTGS